MSWFLSLAARRGLSRELRGFKCRSLSPWRGLEAPPEGSVAAGLAQSPALADTPMADRLDAVIDRWVGSERILGAVVIVARDGEIVYQRGAGMADREDGVPATEDTIFRHASNTKAIVSVVTLRLIEDGRLSLDDRVADWLPWFTPRLADGRKPEITIRQLMTHTSGLSYSFLEPEGNAYATENVPQGIGAQSGTLEEALRSLAAVPLCTIPAPSGATRCRPTCLAR